MGKNVKTIGESAFFNTPKLKTVRYAGSKSAWKKIVIEADNGNLQKASRTYNVKI